MFIILTSSYNIYDVTLVLMQEFLNYFKFCLVISLLVKKISTCMLHVLSRDGPLLVVASGRDTIPVSSAIKHLSPENVFVVQVKVHFPPKKSCIYLAGKYLILILLLKKYTDIQSEALRQFIYNLCFFFPVCI